MLPRPPISTRSYTLCPYPSVFRPVGQHLRAVRLLPGGDPAGLGAPRWAGCQAGLLLLRLVLHVVRRRHGHRPDVFRRVGADVALRLRSEEHTSELQSLMRISYAVFCLKNKKL